MYVDPTLNEIYVEEKPGIFFDRTSFVSNEKTLLTKEIDGEIWHREITERILIDYGNIDFGNLYKRGDFCFAPYLNKQIPLREDIINFPPFDRYVVYSVDNMGQFYRPKIKFIDGFLYYGSCDSARPGARLRYVMLNAYSKKYNKQLNPNYGNRYYPYSRDEIPHRLKVSFGVEYSFEVKDLFEINIGRFDNDVLDNFSKQIFNNYPILAKILPQDFFMKEYSDNDKLLFASEILEFKAKHTNGASK